MGDRAGAVPGCDVTFQCSGDCQVLAKPDSERHWMYRGIEERHFWFFFVEHLKMIQADSDHIQAQKRNV